MENSNYPKDYLDDEQLLAVNHRGSNLLILAGAGSGKNRTITNRALSYLNEISPENLMVVTFTKKAAKELLSRIIDGLPYEGLKKQIKNAWIGTIHSMCWRMLQENGGAVGLQPNWTVLNQSDISRVMRISARPFGLTDD